MQRRPFTHLNKLKLTLKTYKQRIGKIGQRIDFPTKRRPFFKNIPDLLSDDKEDKIM